MALAIAAVAAIGCSERGAAGETDPVLSQLTVGMHRDSMLKIISGGSTDSLANVYRREAYLIGGTPLELYFYHPSGMKEGPGVTLPESTLKPIVVHGLDVTGWGWAHFDSVARANDLKVRVR